MNWTWNVRSNDGAMNGLEFARCTTAGGFGRVLIHAAPADGHGSAVPVTKDRIWPNGGRYPSLVSTEGHGEHWTAAADYIERNLPAWRRALR